MVVFYTLVIALRLPIPPPDYVVGPAPYTELVLRSIKRLRKRPTLVRSLAL